MLFGPKCKDLHPVWDSHCKYSHLVVFSIISDTNIRVMNGNNAICTQRWLANVAIYRLEKL